MEASLCHLGQDLPPWPSLSFSQPENQCVKCPQMDQNVFHSPRSPLLLSPGSPLPSDHQTRRAPFGGAMILQGPGNRHSSPSPLPPPRHWTPWRCWRPGDASQEAVSPLPLNQMLFPLGHAMTTAPVDPVPTPLESYPLFPCTIHPPLPTQTPHSSHAHPSPAHTHAPPSFSVCTHTCQPWDCAGLSPFCFWDPVNRVNLQTPVVSPWGVNQCGWWDPAPGRVTQSIGLQVSASLRIFSENKIKGNRSKEHPRYHSAIHIPPCSASWAGGLAVEESLGC